jgi:hypothetical protein
MDSFDEKKKRRFHFLNRLYDLTKGNPRQSANMFEIGDELGFTHDETGNITDYLNGEGLAEYRELGGIIALTHDGVIQVEDALSNSSITTKELPSPSNGTEQSMGINDYEIRMFEKMKDAIDTGKRHLTTDILFREEEFPDRGLVNGILLQYEGRKDIAILHTGGIPKRVDLIVPQYGCILRLNELKRKVELERRIDTLKETRELDITPFMKEFIKDHPSNAEVGFVMMQYENTRAHKTILAMIKKTLEEVGLRGVRADDKQYSDDLLHNIRTYMHCCGFGIAVFERIEREDFNPNVSLEVGYMMALEKPVCLLKDKTLRSLHSDIVGRLYKNFDPQDIENTLPGELKKWLLDKSIMAPPK